MQTRLKREKFPFKRIDGLFKESFFVNYSKKHMINQLDSPWKTCCLAVFTFYFTLKAGTNTNITRLLLETNSSHIHKYKSRTKSDQHNNRQFCNIIILHKRRRIASDSTRPIRDTLRAVIEGVNWRFDILNNNYCLNENNINHLLNTLFEPSSKPLFIPYKYIL